MAPKYIFNYFDTPGLGESIRLMFHAAGVEFTDNRMDKETWQKNKPDTRRFPLAKIPTLEVDDEVIIQSNAICRFVAREFGLYGSNSKEQAIIDQVVETMNDVAAEVLKIRFGDFDEETMKAKFGEFFKGEKLSNHMNFLTQLLKKNNDGNGFMVGEKISYGDIYFYGMYVSISQVDGTYVDKFAELKALLQRVADNENIKKYLASQRK